MTFPFNVIIFITILVLCGALYLFWRKERKRKLIEGLKRKLFLIKIHIDSKKSGGAQETKQEISLTEQFLNSFSFFKEPIVFEVAVPSVGEEIHFFASVPLKAETSFVKQFRSLWKNAEISEVEDYTIFNHGGESAGAYLKLAESFILPIKTYGEIESDTFLPVLGGFSKVDEIGEGAALQFIVRPAPTSRVKNIKSALAALKKGDSLKSVLSTTKFAAGDFVKILSPSAEKEEKRDIDKEAIDVVEKKIQKPLYEINVRVVASAPTKEQVEDILNGISAGFSQFSAPQRNGFIFRKVKDIRSIGFKFAFR